MRWRRSPPIEIRPPRLIGGDDLIAMGFKPGPAFKQILAEVEDLHLDGALASRDEALHYVADHYPLTPASDRASAQAIIELAPSMLQANAISKSFGATAALIDVALTARPGEIHALIGENGAGKSTLVSILTGRLRPDGGSVTLEGAELRAGSPHAALAAGIAAVYQTSMLFERMAWEDNLALGGFGRRPEPRRGRRPGGAHWRIAWASLCRRRPRRLSANRWPNASASKSSAR